MSKVTYREALRLALIEEMEREKSVFIMGEDIAIYGGVYKVTQGLLEKFGPERVRNTPISESAIVGVAAGAAMLNSRPIAEIMYIDFCTMAMDPIVNQISKVIYETAGKIKMPLVIRTQGGVGKSNGSTQSQSLESWFCHVPGLKVVMPSNPYDAKGLLKTAIRDDNPVMFIEHKLLYGVPGKIPDNEYLIEFGKAKILKKGKDVSIISISKAVRTCLEAANILEEQGINVEIIDLRTLIPLDINTILNSIKKTNRALVVHESNLSFGIGAEISALINETIFDYLDAPVQRLGGNDITIPFSPSLEKYSIPRVEAIVHSAKNLLYLDLLN